MKDHRVTKIVKNLSSNVSELSESEKQVSRECLGNFLLLFLHLLIAKIVKKSHI